MAIDLILGTAGHVDHGKTSLIRALTGVDTDRLPEEKRRGLTIDLGFALLELPPYRLGIVDCPGHERFVRNMLAGATGMDLVLLVVAADDSIKQQTREHLQILRQLELRGGVVALSKCDLAEPQRMADVEHSIRELLRDSPLADAVIVRTSVVTGAGLTELRTALHDVAARAAGRIPEMAGAPFRLAIDRTFDVAGHGTVVTGSISSGRVRVGDRLTIEPGGIEVRVRGLQRHDQPADDLCRGQRGAVNVVGVHHDEIGRGQELCTPGSLAAARTLTARLRLLPDAPPLKNRCRVRLHIGTAEILAGARLLGCDRLHAGESAYVQFHLAEAAVTTWNQPFVIRRESPLQTLGGGRILDPAARRIGRFVVEIRRQLERLEMDDVAERAGASLYLAGLRGWALADLPRLAGVSDDQAVRDELLRRQELLEVPIRPSSIACVHRQVVAQLAERVVEVLAAMHARQPLRAAVSPSELAGRFPGLEPAILDVALAHLKRNGRLQVHPQGLALAGHGPQLSRGEQQLFDELLTWFRGAGLSAPNRAECVARAKKHRNAVEQLLELATAGGKLVAIGPDYWLEATVEAQAREKVAAALAKRGQLTVSEIRELLATTRKYAVPLCEYWDKTGFTHRRGDQRVLKSQSGVEAHRRDGAKKRQIEE
jgi:selenocysteine-specific elongation factor